MSSQSALLRRSGSCRTILRHIPLALVSLAILGPLAGCGTQTNYQDRTFFRDEYGLETHGRKTWFDHLVELDPGVPRTQVAANYEQDAPAKIAVLPFADRGSAQYVVDKIPLTHRNDGE